MTAIAVDFDHLRTYTGGDAEVERDVLRLFVEHSRDMLRALEMAGDERSWKDAAHSLKGSARGIGAWRIAELSERAEKLAGCATPAERSIALGDLKVALATVTRLIDMHLASAPEPAPPCAPCAGRRR